MRDFYTLPPGWWEEIEYQWHHHPARFHQCPFPTTFLVYEGLIGESRGIIPPGPRIYVLEALDLGRSQFGGHILVGSLPSADLVASHHYGA